MIRTLHAALLLVFLLPLPGVAQAVPCTRPISIADRWDDVTAIPGYTGGAKKTPDWRNNGVWDSESFTDSNGSGLYDPGEPFVDANGNGSFDQEAYHPTLTGYVLDPVPGNILAPVGDAGREITLLPDAAHGGNPGDYLVFDGTNAFDCFSLTVGRVDLLRPNGGRIRALDQGMRDVIAQDGLVLLPLYDPRLSGKPGRAGYGVTKVIGLRLVEMTGQAAARAVFTNY